MPRGTPSLVLLPLLVSTLTGCAAPPDAPRPSAADVVPVPVAMPPVTMPPAAEPPLRPVRITHDQILARLHAANRRLRPTGFNISSYHGLFDWDDSLIEAVGEYVMQAGAMQAVADDLAAHAAQEERTVYNLQLATVVTMVGFGYLHDVRLDAARLAAAYERGDFEWLVRLHADEAWRVRDPIEGLLALWREVKKPRATPTPPL